MSQDIVLQVRDLNVWYRPSGTIGRRKRRQVLHDVSFDLHRGEILGLVGESGSGKTTLARTILGFVPDYTGTVTHFTKRPQMVFQDPASSLNPSRTVGWILAEPLRIYGKYDREEIARRVDTAVRLQRKEIEDDSRLATQLRDSQRKVTQLQERNKKQDAQIQALKEERKALKAELKATKKPLRRLAWYQRTSTFGIGLARLKKKLRRLLGKEK